MCDFDDLDFCWEEVALPMAMAGYLAEEFSEEERERILAERELDDDDNLY